MTLCADGRTLEHWYTISLHMSLQLRRAEKAHRGGSLAYMFILLIGQARLKMKMFDTENRWTP